MNTLFNAVVEYRIECLPEHVEIRGNVLASGDAEEDKRAEDAVIKQLNSGNEWAWCCVKVTAYIEGLPIEGTDYLGCCSYRSQHDFEQDGYFEDMKNRALEDLKTNIASMVKTLKEKGLL